jgi:hypothetical protein
LKLLASQYKKQGILENWRLSTGKSAAEPDNLEIWLESANIETASPESNHSPPPGG